MALGGSTNAAVHLDRHGAACRHRSDASTTWPRWPGKVPVCANLFPSGEYLMEDFYFAGGLLALLRKLEAHLELDALTVNGRTLGENIAGAECWNDDVIRDPDNPVVPLSRGKTLAVLRGNLAPDGAVMKSSAANPRFLKHVGPAIVFDSPAEMNRAIDDPDLDVTEDSVLVLRNAGPVGAPGMPEWGNLPIPKKLLKQGVRDMVRICDGRMSGTHYGTCILHVAPEAAVGGPLGSAQDRRSRRARRGSRARSTCGWTKPSWNAAGPRGSRRLPSTDAPSRRSTSAMSRRPTRAATSIS